MGIESENDPNVVKAYGRIYKSFVESVDAIDNGINQFDGTPRFDLF